MNSLFSVTKQVVFSVLIILLFMQPASAVQLKKQLLIFGTLIAHMGALEQVRSEALDHNHGDAISNLCQDSQQCIQVGKVCTSQLTPACKDFLENPPVVYFTDDWFDGKKNLCGNLSGRHKVAHGLRLPQHGAYINVFGRSNGEPKAEGFFVKNAHGKIVFITDKDYESIYNTNLTERALFELHPQCKDFLEHSSYLDSSWVVEFEGNCSNLSEIIREIATKLGLAKKKILLRLREEHGFSVRTTKDIIISLNIADLHRSILALKGVMAHELCHVHHGDLDYFRSGNGYQMEFNADACAARTVGASAMLASIQMHALTDTDTDSHPSSQARVQRLEWLKDQEEVERQQNLATLEQPLVPCTCP